MKGISEIMKFYFAPMEGITGYIYRKAHHTYFDHIDKYFAPFIVAHQRDNFKTREINDILPENNQGVTLIPQLLTNNAKDFIYTSKKIKEFGYDEINLNLGCPSGTVVSKNRGSGFLAKIDELDDFLYEVFTSGITKISVKTRIGKDEPDEFYELIEIFNKYPMEELIIHPRIQTDFYKNKPNMTVFKDALHLSKNPVCYNGDIVSVESYEEVITANPRIATIMIGRGLVVNPGLTGELLYQEKLDKKRIKEFHDYIYYEYKQVLFGDRNILFKMKEIWFHMIQLFLHHDKYSKKIRKSERLVDYEEVIKNLFEELELV